MDRNRHMNLFEEYTHGEKMPLENNLTRGLAIVLEENPLLSSKKLNEIKINDRELEQLIAKRILSIKEEYIKSLQNDEIELELEQKRKAIPLDFPYVCECNLWYENKEINAVLYLGSTGGQFWQLAKNKMLVEMIEKRNHKICNIEEFTYDIEIVPYLKVSDSYGRCLFTYETNNSKISDYFNLVGRFDRENKQTIEWLKNEKNYLNNASKVLGNQYDEFRKLFHENVGDRTRINTTTEFKVMGHLPFEKAQELDAKNKMGAFITSIIKFVD